MGKIKFEITEEEFNVIIGALQTEAKQLETIVRNLRRINDRLADKSDKEVE